MHVCTRPGLAKQPMWRRAVASGGGRGEQMDGYRKRNDGLSHWRVEKRQVVTTMAWRVCHGFEAKTFPGRLSTLGCNVIATGIVLVLARPPKTTSISDGRPCMSWELTSASLACDCGSASVGSSGLQWARDGLQPLRLAACTPTNRISDRHKQHPGGGSAVPGPMSLCSCAPARLKNRKLC